MKSELSRWPTGTLRRGSRVVWPIAWRDAGCRNPVNVTLSRRRCRTGDICLVLVVFLSILSSTDGGIFKRLAEGTIAGRASGIKKVSNDASAQKDSECYIHPRISSATSKIEFDHSRVDPAHRLSSCSVFHAFIFSATGPHTDCLVTHVGPRNRSRKAWRGSWKTMGSKEGGSTSQMMGKSV